MYGQNKKFLITWVDNKNEEHCRHCNSRDQINYLIKIHKLTNKTCTILYQVYSPAANKTRYEIKNKDFFADNDIDDLFHTALEVDENKSFKTGEFRFRLRPVEGIRMKDWPIIINYRGTEFRVSGTSELENLIIDQKLPLRMCTACGKPMVEGYVVNGEEYYCTDQEFKERMDQIYGHGNWRKNPLNDGICEFQYKEEGSDRWIPEFSHYKKWE